MVAEAGINMRPSGFACVEASLATIGLAATPTEQVIECSCATWRRMYRAISTGEPHVFNTPSVFRYASSIETASTSVGRYRNRFIKRREKSRYLPSVGGTTAAGGQGRVACAMGIAKRTPKGRAS